MLPRGTAHTSSFDISGDHTCLADRLTHSTIRHGIFGALSDCLIAVSLASLNDAGWALLVKLSPVQRLQRRSPLKQQPGGPRKRPRSCHPTCGTSQRLPALQRPQWIHVTASRHTRGTHVPTIGRGIKGRRRRNKRNASETLFWQRWKAALFQPQDQLLPQRGCCELG